MRILKLSGLCSILLLPLTLLLTIILYRYVILVPGSVEIAIAGIICAAPIGYYFARNYGRSGLIAVLLSCSLFALSLSLIFIFTAVLNSKLIFLAGLGYWAIPFVGIVASLFGEQAKPSDAIKLTSKS